MATPTQLARPLIPMTHKAGIRRRRVAFGLGAVVGAPLLFSGCNRIPPALKIGVGQPLSGPIAALGRDMLNGIVLAVEELNAENFAIDGQPVKLELVVEDDRSDPAVGKLAAQTLIDAGVFAVMGHLNSGVSMAAAPLYGAHDILQLSISTHPGLTELGLPGVFRIVANDHTQSRAMAGYAIDYLGQGPIGLVDDGSAYGKGLAGAVAAEFDKVGKTLALRDSLDDKTTDFAALASTLKQRQIGVLLSVLNDFQVVALVEALKAADHLDMHILGGDLLKTPEALKAARTLRGRLLATSPILEPLEFNGGPAFLSTYRERFKKDPAYGAHYNYDALHALAFTLRQVRGIDPEKVRQMLHTNDPAAPVTGSMRFDARGEQRHGVVGIYSAAANGWRSLMRSSQW